MVITDSFHSDIEGKNYKFGTPNKLNKTSKPLILFYFVQDYKRTWDEANPLNYDDPQLKNDAIVTKIESEGDVLNISLFDYESLDETELRFEVGKETSISKVVDENDHTKEYKFIPTKIVVADSLEKGSKVYDELIETVWTNYYIKNSKEGEKIPKVAENVENLAAEGHSHNKSSYKKCAECSDSVFELEEEICFECSSFEADYTKGYTDTTQKIEYEDNYGKPKEVIVQGLSGYAGNCPSCSKRINFPIDSSGLYCYDCQVYLRPSKGTGMDKTLQYDAESKYPKCVKRYCTKPVIVEFGNGYCSQKCESRDKPDWMMAETFEDCEVCYATVDKGTLNDVQAGRICNECHKMNQYEGGTKTIKTPYNAETFEANAKTGNKVYIITRRCEDYSAYRELDVAGFGSLTEARKKFNILFKEAKKQDYADETIADAKDYMSWGEYWGIMSFNNGEMIYELREVIVGEKGDFYFDAETFEAKMEYA